MRFTMVPMSGFQRTRTFLFLLVFLCTTTLIVSSFLHNIIPHDHGSFDDHGHMHESSIWQDLHSALQHEKKSFVILTETFTLLVLCLGIACTVRVFLVPSRALLYDPVSGSVLRKGIVAHRAFR